MPAARATIATVSTGNVAFTGNPVTNRNTGNLAADFIDLAHEFVTDRHRHRNRMLGPLVPVIYVQVGAADGCLADADQDIVVADLRFGDIFQPDAGFRASLH